MRVLGGRASGFRCEFVDAEFLSGVTDATRPVSPPPEY
jgi:hypothetical protein